MLCRQLPNIRRSQVPQCASIGLLTNFPNGAKGLANQDSLHGEALARFLAKDARMLRNFNPHKSVQGLQENSCRLV
jgi:hypothetical protein